VRSHVTEQLWRLLMEDYSLEQQLQAVKDFYLMGRGEFYLAFIDLAGPLLDKPPHRMLGQQLRACFERAARAVGLEDDQALKQFDVWFDDSQAAAAGAGGSASDADSWSRVGLKFKHGWPFHLLFNDDILARYCQVFRFLLTVKRVQLTLQRSWAAQMIAKRGCRNSRVNSAALSKLEPHFLQRSRMQHAVDNLVYYLQVDVIDSRFNALITAARTQRDVEQLQVSHDQFVTALTAQSFLHNRPVRACVTQLLHSCLEFAGLLRNSLDSQRVDLDSLLQRMTALGQDFHRQTWHLLGMLTGLQAHYTAMSSAKASQPFWPATVLLLLACLYQPSVSQRYGQPIHKFFTNPLVRYPGGAEVNFVDSTIRRIALPHPVIFGATRTAYHEMFLHKQIPGFVFFRNPNVPPDIEALYPKPYVKVLNEFRDRSQNKVDFFVRSIRISATANCVDRKFANLFKDTANQVFTYSDTGYFSPQSITAVTFRRPAGQAVGSLAEIVFVNSGVDTVAFVTYGGVPASDLHAAGFYDVGAGSSGSLALPPRFTEESNMAESGSWAFRLSHPTGVASANVDQSLRRILDMTAQTQGFLSDRLLGCPCSLCDSRAKCLNIASETMRVIDGFAKCCRCQGLNSYLGNGYECADTGTPLPVFFPSLPSDSSANSNVEGNATFVQGNLDIFFRPMDSSSPSPTQRQLTALIKLSEPVLANIALLTAASKSDSIQNLFALSNVIRRRMQLTAMDERKTTTYASWTIEQTIWNQVLFKATNTTIKIDSISDALSSGLAVALLNQDQRATQYEFTRVQRNWLTLESRPPTNFTVTPIPIDFTKSLPTLRIDFTDTWDLSPSCQVETRVGKLLLERDYNQLDMPEGFHFTRLVGNVTRLRTCRDLTCGPGSQCVVEGPVGQAQCRCLPGYVESGAGACRAVCGPNLCDVNAECLINKCICASGYSGDGLVCQADDRDCRLAQAACRPEDGFACMQQATRSGIEYRCQCGSSKCIREADAACRQQAGCSQFANCLPGANGGPSTCVCRQGFKGDGRVCLPELCADNATCSDAGAYAFCNASRLCDTCPPPKSIAAGRCLSRPCQPSDCMENAQCDPVSNACVCKPGFAANRLGGCSIACRTVQDCNKDVLPNDLEILNATMGCMSGVCECRPGYTVDRQDATSLTLTCTNCDSDSMCLRGATCQTDVRLSGVRLCKCPPGKVGNGKSACDECQPGQTGSSPLACGTNAKCESRPGGRTCRCRYGYKSENPKITLYEGQTEMEMFCRVIRGPVRTKDLIWTAIKGVPMPIDEGTDRLVQFVLNDRKVLRFSRVVKSDAKEYHCFPSVAGEDSASLSVNITVLDNPCRQCHAQAFCNYSRPGCQCSRGYSGDGVNRCDRASCIEQQLCDPDTELCLFNRDTGQYTCECAPGMERVQ
uniref:EGF-like domain-containing protein n=1 Tax=Macrostomum lignano TaxID=282301 RepID=A0A1I8IRK2_9PLAT